MLQAGCQSAQGWQLRDLGPPQAPLAVGETLSLCTEEFSLRSETVPPVSGAQRGAVHGRGSEQWSRAARTHFAAEQELRT